MELVKSPLNYVGGKYKLLPQILPLFPDNINTFVDLFAGGCNVAVNVKANKYIVNDTESEVINLIKHIYHIDLDVMLDKINTYIETYKLDRENSQGYLDLRADYNNESKLKHPLHFYTLICHSFSNQIRFNSNGEFNMPFGKRTFNDKLRNRFIKFVERIKTMDIDFRSQDFREFEFQYGDFTYIDPPYLLGTASYNENGGWTERDDCDLLSILDSLNKSNIKFALSNVFENKGKINERLIEWSKQYKVHHLNNSYSDSNYQSSDRGKDTTIEVLITNY